MKSHRLLLGAVFVSGFEHSLSSFKAYLLQSCPVAFCNFYNDIILLYCFMENPFRQQKKELICKGEIKKETETVWSNMQ